MKALADVSVGGKKTGRGADPVGNTPEQFADYLKKDMERWAKRVKSTNVKVRLGEESQAFTALAARREAGPTAIALFTARTSASFSKSMMAA